MCGLQGTDLETKNGLKMLHVQRTQAEETNDEGKHIGYKVVDHCKTDAGNRTITLSDDAIRLLDLGFPPKFSETKRNTWQSKFRNKT